MYKIRTTLNLSEEQLGHMIGVSEDMISDYEADKEKLDKTKYIALRSVIDYMLCTYKDNDKMRFYKMIYRLVDQYSQFIQEDLAFLYSITPERSITDNTYKNYWLTFGKMKLWQREIYS